MKISLIMISSICILFSSCKYDNSQETIEMIGVSEKEIATNRLAISFNFNGDADQKQLFTKLIEQGELSEFSPKLLYQNIHQEDGFESSGKKLIYSVTYLMILEKGKDITDLSKIVEKHKIPGYLSSNGTYVDLAQIETLQTDLFEVAFENAKTKIKSYADALGRDYKVVEVSELDDMGSYINAIDGIVYNNRLGKKVKVKATLK